MSKDTVRVLIEIKAPLGLRAPSAADLQQRIGIEGLSIDPGYAPIPGRSETGEPVLTFRGTVPIDQLSVLKAAPGVVGVWTDAPVEPFHGGFGRS